MAEHRPEVQKNLKNAIVLASFPFGILTFALPVYTQRIGGDALALGGLFSVFSLLAAVLRPLVGKGVDRRGAKGFLAAALLCYAASMLLFSFSRTVPLLYVSRLVQAVGASLMWTPAYTLMAESAAEPERGKALGRVDAAASRGAMYGADAGFAVLLLTPLLPGWSILFKAYAALALAAAAVVLFRIPNAAPKPEAPAGGGAKTPFKPDFVKLLGVVFLSASSSSMLSPILLVYLQDRFTKDVGLLALAFIPSALISAFLPSRLGGIGDRFGRLKPMVLGLTASAAASFGIVGCRSLVPLAVLWAVEALGAAAASPAETSLVADLAGENVRGSAYGLYLFTAGIGAAAGPLLGGFLYDSAGHAVPFILNGALLLLDALLAAAFWKGRGQSPAKPVSARRSARSEKEV